MPGCQQHLLPALSPYSGGSLGEDGRTADSLFLGSLHPPLILTYFDNYYCGVTVNLLHSFCHFIRELFSLPSCLERFLAVFGVVCITAQAQLSPSELNKALYNVPSMYLPPPLPQPSMTWLSPRLSMDTALPDVTDGFSLKLQSASDVVLCLLSLSPSLPSTACPLLASWCPLSPPPLTALSVGPLEFMAGCPRSSGVIPLIHRWYPTCSPAMPDL